VPHQEAVPGMRRGRRAIAVGTPVETGQRDLVAAVGNVVEQPAVSPPEIGWRHQREVRAVLDTSDGITRRLVQVDDRCIQVMRWIEFPMDRVAHALIRPDRAKDPAIEDGGQAFDDFDAQDAPGCAVMVSPPGRRCRNSGEIITFSLCRALQASGGYRSDPMDDSICASLVVSRRGRAKMSSYDET
jgi:hypothetical protein